VRIALLLVLSIACACTGRALRVDLPDAAVAVDAAAAPDAAVIEDLARPADLAELDYLCSEECGYWDHCSVSGGLDDICTLQCEAGQSGYVCLLGCNPKDDCATFLTCVAACNP
jgi:hypothetical protein